MGSRPAERSVFSYRIVRHPLRMAEVPARPEGHQGPGQPRPAFLQGERVRLDCGDLPGPEAVAALEDLDDIFLLRVLPGAPLTPLTPRVGL